MKIIQQSIVILGLCLLPASTGRGQDLVAAFKIANSPRPFLFNFHSPSSGLGSRRFWLNDSRSPDAREV
jgi:hypothetical protein